MDESSMIYPQATPLFAVAMAGQKEEAEALILVTGWMSYPAKGAAALYTAPVGVDLLQRVYGGSQAGAGVVYRFFTDEKAAMQFFEEKTSA